MGAQTLHKMDIFANLNGGWNTLSTPLLSERDRSKRMMSPDPANIDMFYDGGIQKRLGKTIQGTALASVFGSQTSTDGNASSGTLTNLRGAICQQFVAGANASIVQVTVKLAEILGTGSARTMTAIIFTDSGGQPGAQTGNASAIRFAGATPVSDLTFTFPIPVPVTNATTYWLVIQSAISTSGNTGGSFVAAKNGSGSSGRVKTTLDAYATFSTSTANDLYFYIYATSVTNVVQGLYDYRFGTGSTQRIMAAVGGVLSYHARNATPLTGAWSPLTASMQSGQNTLFSFATFKNLLFFSDGVNANRVWDGTTRSPDYTIAQGFRATFALADSAAAGTVPPGFYWIMPVTTLISGGYRSGAPVQIQVTGASNHQIVVSSIVMDGTGATNFGFDINALATTWFMTTVTAATTTSPGTFYKIPTANCSAANPAANSTTTFNITATTNLGSSATLSPTLLDAYNLEQGYFTSQITTPIAQYMTVWQGFLVMNDIANPSYLRISPLNEPNVWSTFGGIQGSFQEINTNDGEVITGLAVQDGFLYVFKRHGTFIVQYTSNSTAPYAIRQISTNIGALSHWSCKSVAGRGLFFFSQRGPALVSGTQVAVLPASANITNKFEPNDSTRYNLAVMAYTTAGHNTTKSQIFWGVSSTSATTRDLTLVYDYSKDAVWQNDVSANYYNEITDGNFFPSVWSGDYSAQIFQMDNGTNDNGSAISFSFPTPVIQIGSPFYSKRLEQFHIAGVVQSTVGGLTPTLTVEVYLDFSATASQSFTVDMTDSKFESGIAIPIGVYCKAVSFVLQNSQLNVPVQLQQIGISYSMVKEASGAA